MSNPTTGNPTSVARIATGRPTYPCPITTTRASWSAMRRRSSTDAAGDEVLIAGLRAAEDQDDALVLVEVARVRIVGPVRRVGVVPVIRLARGVGDRTGRRRRRAVGRSGGGRGRRRGAGRRGRRARRRRCGAGRRRRGRAGWVILGVDRNHDHLRRDTGPGRWRRQGET